MSGLIRSLTSAVTTVPKAAPITTPTARSTTLPRKINCLKPDSIGVSPPTGVAANLNVECLLVKLRQKRRFRKLSMELRCCGGHIKDVFDQKIVGDVGSQGVPLLRSRFVQLVHCFQSAQDIDMGHALVLG